jgi:PhnB protein
MVRCNIGIPTATSRNDERSALLGGAAEFVSAGEPVKTEVAMSLTPYLFFDGRCEEALRFYESCGLGKIDRLMRYSDAPAGAAGTTPPGNSVFHAKFKGAGFVLLATDGAHGRDGFKGFSLSLDLATLDEALRLYDALSAGGVAEMPVQSVFWGGHFGMLTDKFGVNWMLVAEHAAPT